MMDIENEIYYRIQNGNRGSRPWIIGNIINISDNQLNGFYNHFNTNSCHICLGDNEYEPLEAYKILKIDDNEPIKTYSLIAKLPKDHLYNLIVGAKNALQEQALFLRETIFEEIRKSEFSYLPSRRTCLWVTDEKGVPKWYECLCGENTKIHKLQLSGQGHKSREEFLKSGFLPHDSIRESARKYWSYNGDNYDEILFTGCVRVLDEYSNIEEFNDRHK